MEKSKEVEKFQLEFDLYSCGNVGPIERTISSMFLTLEEIDVARSVIDLDRRRNRRRRFLSNTLGKHAEKFGYLDPWYYDMDDGYLAKQEEILDVFHQQINDIYREIDDDNYPEVYRLLSFTEDKNKGFIAAVKEERRCIKASASGDAFERTLPKEDPKAFQEWFKGALEAASYVENVEKVRK